jgi:hypothetical protein
MYSQQLQQYIRQEESLFAAVAGAVHLQASGSSGYSPVRNVKRIKLCAVCADNEMHNLVL